MELLKVGDLTLPAAEVMPLLSKTGMLPRLVQEVVIEAAIAGIELTPEEVAAAEAEFCKRNQINTPDEAKAWAQQRYGAPDLVPTIAARERRLAKFKQTSFSKEVDSYFLQRKRTLDRVLYSLIRTTQVGLAQELYFRIHDDGQPFADLAKEYSEGQEAKTGGLIGPVELSVPHPSLAGMLSISQPGQVWPPRRIGEWYIVVRLEKFFPAQLDEAMEQRLMDEMFQQWLKEQLQGVAVSMLTPDTIPVQAEAVSEISSQGTDVLTGKNGELPRGETPVSELATQDNPGENIAPVTDTTAPAETSETDPWS
ncbi:MAG: peptidylprolyl isomerase [Leptolyngbya sp. SIO1E4]|nr:peptidylprolyl isomerase [Leptolyngbya sp. SIO1E4]